MMKAVIQLSTTTRYLGIAALAAVLLQGQAVERDRKGEVRIWSAAELRTTAGKLERDPQADNIAGTTLGSYGSQSASLWHRAKSGQAELHRAKVDLIVVQQGSATLVYGGEIPGARATAPNEMRGASVAHGQTRKLAPGDIVRIPAGIPHQFILEKGEQVAYFALKIAR